MTTNVEARCACGLNTFNLAFTTANLPVPNSICHCNSCRHLSGQLARNHAPFQGAPICAKTRENADLSTLVAYKSSEHVTRWFCGTCSGYMFAKHALMPDWYVSVGILQKSDGIISSKSHIWVSDTLDGGLADHLPAIDGHVLLRYSSWAKGAERKGDVLPVGWKAMATSAADSLSMYCHCKTISFSITRPNPESAVPSYPYPDLLFPFHSTSETKILNPGDEKWWLRPAGAEKPSKYLAGYCACASCTLTSGSEFSSWAIIPLVNIKVSLSSDSEERIDLNLIDESKRPKGLKKYISSPGCSREFCEACGANVFRWDQGRPELVAVATGLVDQEQEGARAEGWLEWHRDRVAFAEESMRKTLVEGLVEGSK